MVCLKASVYSRKPQAITPLLLTSMYPVQMHGIFIYLNFKSQQKIKFIAIEAYELYVDFELYEIAIEAYEF